MIWLAKGGFSYKNDEIIFIILSMMSSKFDIVKYLSSYSVI